MSINLLLLFSLVTGYVQTPIGGQPGTTSLLRPTLEELTLKPVSGIAQITTVGKVYSGYQKMRVEGDTFLREPLRTYGKFIAARTPFKTGLKLDWYRLGVRYPVQLLPSIRITPAIELIIFDFGYRFKTPILQSGRTYRQMGVRVGVIVQKDGIVYTRFMSLPGLGRVLISTQSVGTALHGQQAVNIFFKDSQPLPNQIFFKAEGTFIATPTSTHNLERPSIIDFLKKKSLIW